MTFISGVREVMEYKGKDTGVCKRCNKVVTVDIFKRGNGSTVAYCNSCVSDMKPMESD